MKKLFLTSSVDCVAHDFARHFDQPIKGMKLVFILTANEISTSDKSWEDLDRQSLIEAGFEVTDYTISEKTTDQLRQDLAKYEVIYVSGGNTAYLLQQAQKIGFIPVIQDLILKQNKIYIGTSAGSIIAGPDIHPAIRLEKLAQAPDIQGFTGFGFVNFVIFPHWGADHFKELYLNRRLDFSYTETQWPIIVLTNHQYVLVEDEHIQIIDTTDRS